MTSKKIFFIVMAIALSLSFGAQAKKLTVLSINKGETPDDIKDCECTISEDNVEKTGDFSLLLKFTKTGWAGVDKPKKGAWNTYKKVYFNVFNPSDKPVEDFGFMIKGAKMTDTPENRKDWMLTLKPGKNEFSLDLKGQICNDGKSTLDVSRLLRWCFWSHSKTADITVYVQKIWLEE